MSIPYNLKKGINIFNLNVLTCIPLSLSIANAQKSEKKNVLLIIADDFNHWAHSIGYYSQSVTPNIDELGRKGVLFTEAHCSSPVSNPSRNALWSGYRPSTSGIDNNAGGFIRNVKGFEHIQTMNQYFKDNGYYVYGIGKLYHPSKMDPLNPDCDPDNWSEINIQQSGCKGGNYSRWQAASDNSFSWSGNENTISTSNCADYAIAQQVASLITGYASSVNKDKPFFIACGFFRPHLPWNSPVQFWNLFNEDTLNIPKGYLDNDLEDIPGAKTAAIHEEIVTQRKWKEGIRAYLASLALTDYNIGIILSALEKSSYSNNTIIVFFGDHGWHLGEKDRWSKYAVYDQANHTTLIIYDPFASGNGKICNKVVSLQDIYPTLVDLCGLPPKTDIEGRSLKELLINPGSENWDWPVLMTYSGTSYIKTNTWKLVDNESAGQLYKIDTDPYEWNNLYYEPTYSNVISMLKTKIDSLKQIGILLKTKLLQGYTFHPVPLNIPGRIEAEDYDEGADGLTYHDNDASNSGLQYRVVDGVDIEITTDESGSFNITSTMSGEWLNYTISSFDTGNYYITIRACNTTETDSKIAFYCEDREIGQIVVPAGNSNWSNYSLPFIKINNLGLLHFRIVILEGGAKINYYDFVKVTTVSTELVLINDGKNDRLLLNETTYDNCLRLNLERCNPVVQIEIFTIDGKKIEENIIIGETEATYKIKSRLSTGVYIVRLSDGIINYTERFIKL